MRRWAPHARLLSCQLIDDASPLLLRPPRSDELKRPAVAAELVPQPKTHDAVASPPRHQLSALFGPFAARAATLQAEALAAAAGVRAAAVARGQANAAAAPQRGTTRMPRRALLQNGINTEAVLIALIILLVDFFLGFYTGYLKGFFT